MDSFSQGIFHLMERFFSGVWSLVSSHRLDFFAKHCLAIAIWVSVIGFTIDQIFRFLDSGRESVVVKGVLFLVQKVRTLLGTEPPQTQAAQDPGPDLSAAFADAAPLQDVAEPVTRDLSGGVAARRGEEPPKQTAPVTQENGKTDHAEDDWRIAEEVTTRPDLVQEILEPEQEFDWGSPLEQRQEPVMQEQAQTEEKESGDHNV